LGSKFKVSAFRIGDAPKRGEGLRVGATRRPPRGIAKQRWRSRGYFDVWFPVVAPSEKLLRSIKKTGIEDPKVRKRFFDAYRRELQKSPASHGVSLLAAVASSMPIAVGCYCADETRCHRSVLAAEIAGVAS
jgi:uncharacterized protein YeaO (DUF488 family)